MVRFVLGFAAASLTVFILYHCSSIASALTVERPCADIDVVFARGSGQELEGDEYSRFRDQFIERVKDPIKINFYELGTEAYSGQKYQATTVEEWWSNGNAVGAGLSAGLGNDYGVSVDSGVSELQGYLVGRSARCPSARIILGGYSQGAQVVGQALSGLSSNVQSKIDFVALFGDPKLHLPEGEGVYPPACHGANLSQWRRVIGNCKADNGVLGARKPFLPQVMEGKTGLWCNADDLICGTSKNVTNNTGHGQYKDIGGAIDLAVVEIAQRLKLTLPPAKAIAVNTNKYTAGMGTTGTDTVFLLNSSGWTTERFAQSKDFIKSLAFKLQGQHNRVALVYYDGGVDWAIIGSSRLLEDQTEFQESIEAATLGVSTTPVKPILRMIMNTFDFYEHNHRWKKGAMKSIVVVSDSPFFNPDDYGRLTFDSVAKRSLEIDPVNVYPVIPSFLKSSYHNLAEMTSGQVIVADDNPTVTLETAVAKIIERPTALLKNMEYLAQPGQEVVFDASDSYVTEGTIIRYEWDFDGDGIFEQTTTTPIAAHTYSQVFRGNMQVRLTDSNNTTANTSAVVDINDNVLSSVPSAPVNLVAIPSSTANKVSTVDLSWRPNNEMNIPANSWAISMNGIVLGKLSSDRVSIQVTDVLRDKDVELSVTGITSDGTMGETASVIVPKLQSEPLPPKSTWLIKLILYLRNILNKYENVATYWT